MNQHLFYSEIKRKPAGFSQPVIPYIPDSAAASRLNLRQVQCEKVNKLH